MISRHDFGSRLRTQRERRGVTLESIVGSTKIKQSLLEALERGDASQWPRGLFRRAYIRDYACAIGLPAEPLVAEFVRLFPEDGAPISEDVAAAAQEPMRLTLAVEPDTRRRHLLAQAMAGVAELGAVAVLGGVAWLATGWAPLTAVGTAALVYYPLATVLTGRVLSPTHVRGMLRMPSGIPSWEALAGAAGAVLSGTALSAKALSGKALSGKTLSREPLSGEALPGEALLGAVTSEEPAGEPVPLYLVPRAAVPSALSLDLDLAADDFPQPRTAAR